MGLLPFYPSAKYIACKLGSWNPWPGIELGANVQLIYVGLGGSAGIEFNPLTQQFCVCTKVGGRIGLGAFAGVGLKGNAGFGPYAKNSETQDYEEVGLDVALKGGVRGRVRPPASWMRNASGSVARDGMGVGFGPNAGYGIAAGYDYGKKRLWCFNAPPPNCECG